jgi:repressor LexA
MTARPITAKQQEVYDFIVVYLGERKMPPTLREIGRRFGWKAPAAAAECHVHPLVKKGFLVPAYGRSRGYVPANLNICPCCGREIESDE